MAIMLFSTSGSPHCEAARRYMDARGVQYILRDPAREKRSLKRLISLTGRAIVPALAVGRVVMVGFDPVRWSEMLDEGEKPDPS